MAKTEDFEVMVIITNGDKSEILKLRTNTVENLVKGFLDLLNGINDKLNTKPVAEEAPKPRTNRAKEAAVNEK